MYSRDVRLKLYKDRIQAVHDWIFSSIPGVLILTVVAVTTATLFGSTALKVITAGTFFFLLGNVIGERKAK